ncbi:MAG TPA: type IV secretion system DNA-binding domain-containing protein [Propylenella sp.]|nr:type IV secretion system DNA-binding domain-containing protein [Propylenella sp.]
MNEVREAVEREPAGAVLVEIAFATDQILELEDIEPFDLNWPLIAEDASVGVRARQMIARRKRWALDYDRMIGIVRRQLVGAFTAFLDALPESCFEPWDRSEEPAFAVPLVSLLEAPSETIERLLLALYDDDTMRLDLFLRVRERLMTNLLVASGFPPTANPHEVSDRLVLPTRQKNKSPAELVDLYLAGTPFEALLNLPIPFHVPDAMRFEHCHIIGGTGHGKTQLIQRMIHADLTAAQQDGRSIVVIDSQGDLINKLVRLDLFSPDAPDSLADRMILIDPADIEFPAALNLFGAHLGRLKDYRPVDRERVLNGVVELYESFFGALLGAELTQKQGVIFRYLARLMLAIPGATIHTLMELMEDGRPYRPQMASLEGSARHFFEKEFFHPSFAATKKQILRRLWGVLSTPAFERMFAQSENKLDLFAALNDGSIILINTAKDLLKTEGSQLLGRFFVSMLSQAALERSTVPEHRRTPTYVYVDEAQEYFDDTIETILSQARKYRVGITLAHQTLDQLSPRLRAAFLSNTSLKCAGGVSARDARALAPELHTTPEFIESMRRRGDRAEFAVWLKNRTAEALRLFVPLGFLERQPTMTDEEYDQLIEANRSRYCGTLSDILEQQTLTAAQAEIAPKDLPGAASHRERLHEGPERPSPRLDRETQPTETFDAQPVVRPRLPLEARELGKGGPKHRYLQSLVKELAEQQGFRATIEAPLAEGTGQVDVLLERDALRVAVEVSVTTPAEYELQNVRKCLAAGHEQVALVLAKTRASQGRYRSTILDGLLEEERARVSFLTPEELPDYIAALVPPDPTETTVKGYKVRLSRASISPEEAKERRDRLARVVARSLSAQPE